MGEYRLTDIDPDLWKRVKSQAAYEGRSIRFVIVELLKAYADHGWSVIETFDGKRKK